MPSCNRISLKTLNCASQPRLIKTRAIPGAFLWSPSPSHTSLFVEKPMPRIARDLASVHSANWWVVVWSPCPHRQAGDAIPATPRRNRKARRPVFSVRAWHSTAASAFASDSYRRRCLPWKALCINTLSARAAAAAAEFHFSSGRPQWPAHCLAHSQFWPLSRVAGRSRRGSYRGAV